VLADLVDATSAFGEIRAQRLGVREVGERKWIEFTVELEEGIEKEEVPSVFDDWEAILKRHYTGATMLRTKLVLDEEDQGTGKFKKNAEWWFSFHGAEKLGAAFNHTRSDLKEWVMKREPSGKADYAVGFEAQIEIK
jgi:hypothetical protein